MIGDAVFVGVQIQCGQPVDQLQGREAQFRVSVQGGRQQEYRPEDDKSETRQVRLDPKTAPAPLWLKSVRSRRRGWPLCIAEPSMPDSSDGRKHHPAYNQQSTNPDEYHDRLQRWWHCLMLARDPGNHTLGGGSTRPITRSPVKLIDG